MLASLAAALMLPASATADPLPPLRVATDGHMLETTEGRPFFWLGDTAWELIHRLGRDDARFYLRTRARQGFTVVQTVVLAEFDGLDEPTPEGLRPFVNDDPSKPDPAYFDKVAWIVDEAARDGLYVALLPTWGDKLTAPWGTGPRVFTLAHPEVARAYGRYLAERLRGRTNVIWMLGGDRPATLRVPGAQPWFGEYARKAGWPADTDWTPIWAAMAAGLREGGAERLIAYHPQGGPLGTAAQLGGAAWLSIDGLQSGHGGGHDQPVWDWVARDYARTAARPTIDLEPNYEDHPYNPWPQWDPATGFFTDHDVRKQLYRSVLAGAAGVTYGHHSVWQFTDARHAPINGATRDWVSALHRPGAEGARYLADLLLSRPYCRREPDPTLVVDNPVAGALHTVAARGDGYAFVYVPTQDQTVTIDLARLNTPKVRAWWYDPRTGHAFGIGEIAGGARHAFTSPPYGPDWVLVLDDAARGYSAPGAVRDGG